MESRLPREASGVLGEGLGSFLHSKIQRMKLIVP